MDDPLLPEHDHRIALRALARLNAVSAVVGSIWPLIREESAWCDGTPLSILDVAIGGGDVAIGLLNRARRAGMNIRVSGCDISAVAIDAARAAAEQASVVINLEQRDVVRDGLGRPDRSADVVMSSLFLHHLREEDAAGVLAEMRRVANGMVIVSDLRRCGLGLAAAHLAGRVGTRSRVVRVDAVRSVEGAFSEAELRGLAERAGLVGAMVSRVWPMRCLLMWRRPE